MSIDNKSKTDNIYILDKYCIRTPILSLDDYKFLFYDNNFREGKILEFTRNKKVREVLLNSSVDLFKSFEEIENITSLKRRKQIINSLEKYLIRMTTRSTPFGLVAGVSTGSFSKERFTDEKECSIRHSRISINWFLELVRKIELREYKSGDISFLTNNTIYKSADRLKTLHTLYKNERVSIKNNSAVNFILTICKEPMTVSEIVIYCKEKFPQYKNEDFHKLIYNLISNEFLNSTLLRYTNDFDGFIGEVSNFLSNEFIQKLKEISSGIHKLNSTPIGEGKAIYIDLVNKMKKITKSNDYIFTDLELKGRDFKFDLDLDNLKEYIEVFLSIANIQKGNRGIDEYKNQFLEKYGSEKLVPLVELFDKDKGLENPFTIINQESHHDKNIDIKRRLLLNEIIDSLRNGKDEVVLDNDLINKIKNLNSRKLGQLSLDFCVQIINDKSGQLDAEYKYFIKQGAFPVSEIGGQFAGRLNYINNSLFENQVELINKQDLNKNVILSEINLLVSNSPISNLAGYKPVTEHQLNIISMSNNQTISVDDLYIGIIGNEFQLFSKKYKKQVRICKLNMINHKHYSIPDVYKFIIEIENSKVPLVYPFSLNTIGLPYIPRIRHKNFIISPKTWFVTRADFTEGLPPTLEKFKVEFYKLADKIKLNKIIYLGELDNNLLLNIEIEEHIFEIYKALKTSDEGIITLREGEFDLENTSLQTNQGSFTNELIFTALINNEHKNSIQYYNFNENNIVNDAIYLPCDEWLYFKIYVDKINEKKLLIQLKTYLETVIGSHISRYYFIRYRDPHSHIRLRLKLNSDNDDSDNYKLIKSFNDFLKKYNYIKDFSINTYEPEIVRYGGENLIDLAEGVFMADSKLILELISREKNLADRSLDTEKIGVINVLDIFYAFGIDLAEQLNLLNKVTKYNEHKEIFRKDRNFYLRLFEKYLNNELEIGMKEHFSNRKKQIIKYDIQINKLNKYNHLANTRENIILSVIHMSLIRFIGVNQSLESKIMTLTRHLIYHYLRRTTNYEYPK